MYIAKNGITNSEKQRLEARNKAEFYGSEELRRAFIEWCYKTNKTEIVIQSGLKELDTIADTFQMISEHEHETFGFRETNASR